MKPPFKNNCVSANKRIEQISPSGILLIRPSLVAQINYENK